MRRTTYLSTIEHRLGSDLFKVIDLGDGWPSLCKIRVDGKWKSIALHLGPITGSGRGRDRVERRFQNPGKNKPVQSIPGYEPLLIGLDFDVKGQLTAMVGMDAQSRIGHMTRQSLFVPVATLARATKTGWASHISGSHEVIHVFSPEFLPVFAALNDSGHVEVPDIADALQSVGFDEAPTDSQVVARSRVAALRAVRRSNFGRMVVSAYNGLCSMCGLNSGLIEGAHIFPVEADGSHDEVWNGLALCPTHHRIFDRHLIYIAPQELQISIHPALTKAAESNPACCSLLQSTKNTIATPNKNHHRPRANMFESRYDFYSESYSWVEK